MMSDLHWSVEQAMQMWLPFLWANNDLVVILSGIGVRMGMEMGIWLGWLYSRFWLQLWFSGLLNELDIMTSAASSWWMARSWVCKPTGWLLVEIYAIVRFNWIICCTSDWLHQRVNGSTDENPFDKCWSKGFRECVA